MQLPNRGIARLEVKIAGRAVLYRAGTITV